MDEPEFLNIAAQILRDPFHPLAGFWPGTSQPLWQAYTNPLLWPYLLAPALKLTGGVEWLTRLLFLPLDVAAAVALYLIAARFLSRPLWPTLVLLVCPAWALDMGHLMAEKPFAAFGLWGVYAFLQPSRRWRLASAVLLAAACLTKYAGAALAAACCLYGLWSGESLAGLALFAAAALVPVAVAAAWQRAGGAPAVQPAWAWVPAARSLPKLFWTARMRQVLCFASGTGLALGWLGARLADRKRLIAAAVLAALLFLPAFDLAPAIHVRLFDRAAGAALACAALAAAFALFEAPAEGRRLWLSWIAAWAALVMFVYPAVSGRSMLFLVIPVTLALAELAEKRGLETAIRLPAVCAAAALLSALLIGVDTAYAGAQKDLAAETARSYPGRRIWYLGTWGFQYYFDHIGGTMIDPNWLRSLKSGDVAVIAPRYSIFSLETPLQALVRPSVVQCPIPLRLIGPMSDQANFYGPTTAFLPYTISDKPLDEFETVEIK